MTRMNHHPINKKLFGELYAKYKEDGLNPMTTTLNQLILFLNKNSDGKDICPMCFLRRVMITENKM